MAAPLLILEDIMLTFGGDPLLTAASLQIEPRARIALVGRNGSGKSTLLKIAAGEIAPDGGRRYVDPKATLAYLAQEPDLSAYASVGDYVEANADGQARSANWGRLYDDLALDPHAATENLSGGEARRAAIARVLAADPDVILLDEPTNHLDLPAIEWLEARVKSSRAAIVLISHDRRFLENLTTSTVWMDRGATQHLSRGFKSFEEWRDKLLEEEETAAHKLDRKIAREEDWVRYGVTARRKRNVRRMQELRDLRTQKEEAKRTPGQVSFSISQAARSGKKAIVAENICKSYDGRPIVEDFSIEIARGDRVGFVGPNGAGKTTLLNLLTGELAPDLGEITLGASLELVKLDQQRATLPPDARVADAITDGRGDWVMIGDQKRHVSSYLKDFLFTTEQWRSPVSALSGGERGRLALAAAFAKPSNLLVLDEPTNDLDLETLDLLVELLSDYQGTLLLVSHDRSFLDRIATSVIAPDPSDRPGRWIEYIGGYEDMIAQRGAPPRARSRTDRKTADTKPNIPQPAKPIRDKLSYKEKYALESLPAKISDLQKEIAALKEALADPAFFERDPAAFNKSATALADKEGALAAAEDEWLHLEMKREDLESSG
ncbi:MAG: ATP-binding cassette domain-containing protein [Parvularculaceae bacterium]|nr:ATP-binding cassette domain-containing protein [Parvularculaceae bacterium]